MKKINYPVGARFLWRAGVYEVLTIIRKDYCEVQNLQSSCKFLWVLNKNEDRVLRNQDAPYEIN